MAELITLKPQEKRTVVLITCMLFLGMLGTDIHLATLPQITQYYDCSSADIQLSIPVFLLGVGFSALLYGPLSDKYGRKPIISFGICLAVCGNLFSLLADNVGLFLLSRIIQGLGAGVCYVLARVVLSDIVKGKDYAVISAKITLFTGLSIILGPLLGGYVQHFFSWKANFLLLGGLLFIFWLLFNFLYLETNSNKDKTIALKRVVSAYKHVILNKYFVLATLTSGIGLSAFVAYTSSSSFIFYYHFKLNNIQFGWLTGLVGLGLLISRLTLPQILKKLSLLSSIFLGLVIQCTSGLLLLILYFTHFLNMTLFLLSISGLFFSYTYIVLSASSLSMACISDSKGAAGAVYSCFQMILTFLINYIFSHNAVSNLILYFSISIFSISIVGFVVYAALLFQTKITKTMPQ